jgi:iron complex outermembrane receptor protein
MTISSSTARRITIVIAAVTLGIVTPALRGQTVGGSSNPGAADADLTEVVVTGTRQGGLAAAESPAPIQILGPAALEAAAGNPDLMQVLAQLVPSLTSQAFGFDMSNQTLQARLKGLGPNHVLVLINGKRRHTTANLAIDSGSVYQGGASVDLNFIPESAIDHIEVLTDGAAAQYGSDAIAGVINIILKKAASGGNLSGTYGGYYDGAPAGSDLPFSMNGTTSAVTANVGFEPLENAYLNLTGEIHNHGHSFRGAADARADSPLSLASYPNSNMPQALGYPYVNLIEGDAETHTKLAAFNAGFRLGGDAEIYSFGTYGTKRAASFQNYRQPNVVAYTDPQTGATTYPFPFGFSPQEADQETDYAATVGVKGTLASWNWDLSTSWGQDHHDVYTLNSANVDLYNTSGVPTPLNYYDGNMRATQWTTTLDVNRDFDVGFAGPLNVAYGFESRRDTYQIGAGQAEAYLEGGPAGYGGFAPSDAGSHSRRNDAVYVDFAGKPLEALRVDLAARYEHFSDFGSATVGKLTARYDFAPQFAVRGTLSTGFRAPTLAEEYFSSTNVGPAYTYIQLPPDGPGGKVLGLGDLQPEKSNNLSVGFVFRPVPGMSATLDLYRIRVLNRIVDSGTLYGTLNGSTVSPLINSVITATDIPISSYETTTGINLFTNGINTTTDGADLAFQFPVDYRVGHVDWSIEATYNDTAVTYVRPASASLATALAGSPLYSLTTLSDLSTASPKYVINLGARWTKDKLSVNLQEQIYGPASEWENDDGDNAANSLNWYRTTIPVTPITNLDCAYQLTKALRVNLGARNLFNRYPPQLNGHLTAAYNSNYAVLNNDAASAYPYPLFSPFGIDGGFYYARATYSF